MRRLRFTSADRTKAEGEGWNLFESSSRGVYEIQRDDEQAIFDCDDAALDHVTARAAEGDETARRALALHGQSVVQIRGRREEALTTAQIDERCVVLDCDEQTCQACGRSALDCGAASDPRWFLGTTIVSNPACPSEPVRLSIILCPECSRARLAPAGPYPKRGDA